MADSYVMFIGATPIPPEHKGNYEKWAMEVHYPLRIKAKGVIGIDRYRLLTESSEYPEHPITYFFENMKGYGDFLRSPEIKIVSDDVKITWGSRFELAWMWSARYQMVKSFKNPDSAVDRVRTGFSDAPAMRLEGYDIGTPAKKDYDGWFNRWAYDFYIPILMRLPGIKEYDCYKFIQAGAPSISWAAKKVEHPQYLSVIYFENPEAFEDYERSTELAAFREAIKTAFPAGIEPKWHVLYELMKSWRK